MPRRKKRKIKGQRNLSGFFVETPKSPPSFHRPILNSASPPFRGFGATEKNHVKKNQNDLYLEVRKLFESGMKKPSEISKNTWKKDINGTKRIRAFFFEDDLF